MERDELSRSAAGERAGHAVCGISCLFSEWVLKPAAREVAKTLFELLDIFLVARGYFANLV
jgi:hypothetical protein